MKRHKLRRVTQSVATMLIGLSVVACGQVEYKGAPTVITYRGTDEIFYNPMMGLAPVASYKQIVGENTLVYIEIKWSEVEPNEGEYDFDFINEKYNLDLWRSQGKRVVMRVVCDVPSNETHMDIPHWLYEQTRDGSYYNMEYGKGYSPNYENKLFIKKHEELIKALGEEYGKDDFICFIQLGSIGHWGEWHVKSGTNIAKLPSEAVCNEYVKPYVEAFPHAKLLMRRPFIQVSTYGAGVFNDVVGNIESTNTWLQWINKGGTYKGPKTPHRLIATPKIWNQAPVGGELTSSIPMNTMYNEKWEDISKSIKDSHMTFIGPKIPIPTDEFDKAEEMQQELMDMLGYRYGVVSFEASQYPYKKKEFVVLQVKNRGVAPMYKDWPMYLYLFNERDEVVRKVELPIKLSKIRQYETVTTKVSFDYDPKNIDWVSMGVGIEDPMTNEPAVYLDMDTERVGRISKLY